MTEKRFQIIHLGNPYDFVVKDHQTNRTYGTLQGDDKSLMELLNELNDENEQLKQQLQIFEKFLEGNDLSIDWEEFCGLEECAFENPNFSCKNCIHLKGDVE